jgi:hypothetical protein
MARKMRKFSAGGAQGKYDRRMADIKKDFEKDSKGKSGRALEVLEAKRAQRTADAEDDRAKRTGGDRTATRKAEYDAEQRLSRTRRFGADKPVAAAEPAKVSTPEPAKASEPAKAKPKSFGETFKAERARLGAGKTFTYNGKSFTTNIAGEGSKAPAAAAKTAAPKNPPAAASNNPPKPAPKNPPAAASNNPPKPAPTAPAGTPALLAKNASSDTMAILRATRVAREKKEAEERKKRIGMPAYERMAKGGKVKKEKTMKYAKGGSTPPQPTAAERKSDAKFRESIKDIKVTPEQGKILNKTGKKMAKGGKMATKFGAAMKKKSADTKGRAMPKFAKGGSIDGCAVKGKTKTSMIKMKNGGSC